MATAGIGELQARLGEYLDKVKSGEEVLVTEDGRAVARLVPVGTLDDAAEWGRLQEMARRGEIRLGRPISADFFDMPLPEDPDDTVLKALLEERDEGR